MFVEDTDQEPAKYQQRDFNLLSSFHASDL